MGAARFGSDRVGVSLVAAFRGSAKTTYALNLNAEKEWLNGEVLGFCAPLGHSIKPPVMPSLQQLTRVRPFAGVLRLGQFVEGAVGDYAHPI